MTKSLTWRGDARRAWAGGHRFYVRTGEDFAPADLPGGDRLAALLDPTQARGWGSLSPVEPVEPFAERDAGEGGAERSRR